MAADPCRCVKPATDPHRVSCGFLTCPLAFPVLLVSSCVCPSLCARLNVGIWAHTQHRQSLHTAPALFSHPLSVFPFSLYYCRVSDAPALGCAILGAVAAGLHPDIPSAVKAMVHVSRVIQPNPAAHKQYQQHYQAYKTLVSMLMCLVKGGVGGQQTNFCLGFTCTVNVLAHACV